MKYKNLLDKIMKTNYDSYDYEEEHNYNWKKITDTVDDISINDVLKKFKPEELIDAIGIDKVELILRKRKIDKLKKNIKK